MDQDTISEDRVLDAASALFDDIEDSDMRSAVAQLAAMLLLPDLDWPLDPDGAAVKLTEAAIINRIKGWNF